MKYSVRIASVSQAGTPSTLLTNNPMSRAKITYSRP